MGADCAWTVYLSNILLSKNKVQFSNVTFGWEKLLKRSQIGVFPYLCESSKKKKMSGELTLKMKE